MMLSSRITFAYKLLLLLHVVCLYSDTARGDAIVTTKAMQASTIAEIYITNSSVRIELEIGPADYPVFSDLLPDEVYGDLKIGNSSLTERHQRFLREGFILKDETGHPLSGQVKSVSAQTRISRDDITGDPLTIQPPNAEQVVTATLIYPLESLPASLTFRPLLTNGHRLSGANIGFITFHQGIPVNDFRYLSSEVILELDWEDPWYSKFRHPNLRRQFEAPISVFLYVEPFEVRKEIVLRPKDLQKWTNLELEGRETISVEDQESLKQKVVEYLSQKNLVTIDGQAAKGKLDRIHFLRRTLRKTGVISPPEELAIDSATLGVIYVYPIEKLPQEVSMKWELFHQKIPSVPGFVTDEAGGLPARLTEEDPDLVWTNFFTNFDIPAMVSVTAPPEPAQLHIPIVSFLLGVAFLILCWLTALNYRSSRSVTTSRIMVGIALIIAGLTTTETAQWTLPNPLAKNQQITDEEANSIFAALLQNTYRAFDHREESLVYDRLAHSISGDLLTEVYLQTRQSIELENQGGARVRIKNVSLQSTTCKLLPDQTGFSVRCNWTVAGSVGHWGHLHQRQNAYEADFVVQPREDQWKITQMELLEERRIENQAMLSQK